MSVVASSAPEVVVSGSGKSWTVPLASGGLLIGRSETCGIVLDDRQVSGHHARIYQDPFDRWIVEDLQSRNGVWVGGQRVGWQVILPGETVRMGSHTLTVLPPDASGWTSCLSRPGTGGRLTRSTAPWPPAAR
jgi:pSer/pThr/pTyr-binding forkhead associated (FHA) protein